jgi:hypothetical protein
MYCRYALSSGVYGTIEEPFCRYMWTVEGLSWLKRGTRGPFRAKTGIQRALPGSNADPEGPFWLNADPEVLPCYKVNPIGPFLAKKRIERALLR